MAKTTTKTTTKKAVATTALAYDGKHVQMLSRGGWEYAHRRKTSGIVGIIAVTDAGELILIEQRRPPLDAIVIEIPAGLAGDLAGSEDEALAEAAKRELLEETGYRARRVKQVASGASSAGITDEIITLFVATGLTKVDDYARDPGEQITVRLVPVGKVAGFLKRQIAQGKQVDLKIYAALHFAQE